jgi:CubicO group peptidase (beta-lactamase class C family)
MLTSIVEAASGRSFLDYLRSGILHPAGLTDVYIGATAASGRRPGEVSHDHPGVSWSMLQPAANVMVPNTYGGTFPLENGERSGGLVTSAPTVARFISRHAVWEFGGRKGGTRYGTLDGTTSGAVSRGGRIDFAYVFNRRVTDPEHGSITNAINQYLDSHPGILG